jgi:hypothetical protein
MLSASTNVAFSAYLGANNSMSCFCMFSAFLLSPLPYTHYPELHFMCQHLTLTCIGLLGYSTMDLHHVLFTYTLAVSGLDSLGMEAAGSMVVIDWMWGAIVKSCRGCNQILYNVIIKLHSQAGCIVVDHCTCSFWIYCWHSAMFVTAGTL